MARHLLMTTLLLLLVFPGNAFPDTVGASERDTGSMMTQEEELYALAEAGGGGEMVSGSGGTSGTSGITYPPAQHFVMRPEVFMGAGYRFTGRSGASGSLRAAEYDYLHDSAAGTLRLHYYPLPWMLDLDFDIKDAKDHDGALGVRYMDAVMLDYRTMGMYHNMDHYGFLNVQAAPGDRDVTARYGVEVRDNDLTLTLKSPGRPYHVYINAREFDKEGSVQQRYDTVSFGNNKASVTRDIDWRTQELTAGINGNVMGVFELDYHHTVKRFDNQADRLMFHPVLDATIRDHNSVPDIVTHENVVSLHTNQSWPFSVAATAAWGTKDNEYSRVKAEYDRYYGDATYRITDNLYAAVKYGHQNLNVTNLDTVLVTPNMTVPAGTAVLRDSMSTKRDRGEVSLGYYPAANLLLLAQYRVDSVDRRNYKGWNDAGEDDGILNVTKGSSVTHTGRLSASLTPMKHTKLRASFTATHNGDPSYVSDYRNSYEGSVWGTWTPTPGLVVNGDAKIFRGENPARSGFPAATPALDINRDVDKDTAGAGVTWYAVQGLTLGAHYDYMRLKVRQALVVATTNIKEVPYWDTSHGYTVFGAYCFDFVPLTLSADFTQAWTRGTFFAETPAPDILASLTDQKIRETRGEVKAQCEVWDGWGATLAYGVSQFRDMWKHGLAERDGTAHYGSALLTKRFR